MKKINLIIAVMLLTFAGFAQGGYLKPQYIGWPTDSSQNLLLGWNPETFRSEWVAPGGGNDSVFSLPPDSICVISIGDTVCVGQDSFYITDTTLCVISMGDTICSPYTSDVGVNLYNSNGALTGVRTVDQNGYQLNIQNSSNGRSLRLHPTQAEGYAQLWSGVNNSPNYYMLKMRNFATNGPGANTYLQWQGLNKHFTMGIESDSSSFVLSDSINHMNPVFRYYYNTDILSIKKPIQFNNQILDINDADGDAGDVLVNQGFGLVAWEPISASVKLNEILAADGTNTINNAANQQEWQWNTLAGTTGFRLTSSSTAAASNLQRLFSSELSGTNGTASQTTVAGHFSNAHAGTNALNYGVYASVTNGLSTSAAVYGTATSQYGVHGNATTGYGVHGVATSGNGVRGSSNNASGTGVYGLNSAGGHAITGETTSSGAGVHGYANGSGLMFRGTALTSNTNSIRDNIRFYTQTSGTAANGFGGQFAFYTEASDGTDQVSNTVTSSWTDATVGTRTSEMSITGVNSASSNTILTLHGDGRIITNGTVRLKGYTVGTLPGTATVGDIAYVTDALAPTYAATVVGGGAVVIPVFYNGTNWIAY